MTPRISVEGMRLRFGGSASKMNLFVPVGMGPTRRESSSWSCSDLNYPQQSLKDIQDGNSRCRRADISQLPFKICSLVSVKPLIASIGCYLSVAAQDTQR